MSIKPYWATAQGDELLTYLEDRVRMYQEDLSESGLLHIMRRSFTAFYGGELDGGKTGLFSSAKVNSTGGQGQIRRVKENHYRNFGMHYCSLLTSNRLAFQARATNSDYKSQAQAIFGTALVDYYCDEKGVRGTLGDAAQLGLIVGKAGIHSRWAANIGEVYTLDDNGRPVHEGDLEFSIVSQLDLVEDPRLPSGDPTWRVIRGVANRYDLAAQYPEVAEKIMMVDPYDWDIAEVSDFRDYLRPERKADTDLIPRFFFYHAKTPAMPKGRLVELVPGAILLDVDLPYDVIPVRVFRADALHGTPYGYSRMWDLLGLQEAHDVLTSALSTNNYSQAVQNIWTKKGDSITVEQLPGNLNHMQSDELPQAVQLTKSAPETYQLRSEYVQGMGAIAGISSTMRGNPEANLKSGAALALVVSQSLQFSNAIEEAYATLAEGVASDIVSHLKNFAQTKRVANILGEASRPFQREFVAEDLSAIARVVVERTNALSKTVAGRIEIARDLLANGMIENANQYIMVLTTGRLDVAVEGKQHALLNIRAENEALRNGEDVIAVLTDNHPTHILEHRTLLDSPEARRDPEFVEAILAHIQEHLDLLQQVPPELAAILGLPAPMQPPMEGPAPAPVDGPPPPLPGEMPEQPNMPNLPTNAPPEAQAEMEAAGLTS